MQNAPTPFLPPPSIFKRRSMPGNLFMNVLSEVTGCIRTLTERWHQHSMHVYLWKLASSSSSSAATSAPSALASVTFPFRMTNLSLFLVSPGTILPHATVCVQSEGASRVVRERRSAFVYGAVGSSWVWHACAFDGRREELQKQTDKSDASTSTTKHHMRVLEHTRASLRIHVTPFEPTPVTIPSNTTQIQHTAHHHTAPHSTAPPPQPPPPCAHSRQHTKGDIERAKP